MDKKEEYQQLCENGEKTTTTLHDSYQKSESRSLVVYQYDYIVNGKTYTEKISTNRLP